MSNLIENKYVPDYAVHPGEILEECLAALEMTQTELSRRTDIVIKHINEIVKGKAPVTPDTALKLARVFDYPAHFWSNLQLLYDETLVRLADQERLQDQLEWLNRFPVKKMAEYGWIKAFENKLEQMEEMLRFFAVVSPEQWQEVWERHQAVAFRQSQHVITHAEAISAWLRRGEIEAQKIPCAAYDRSLFKEVLAAVRPLSRELPQVFQPAIVKLCANVGVAVVFVPELPKTGISGATRWLAPNKALIQLSLRYKSNDQLWFAFFHEAAHILLHGKKDVFLNGFAEMDQEKEDAANQFAADFLIPPNQWDRFKQHLPITVPAVEIFAKELDIAPGIVVGRLQRENIKPYSWVGRNLIMRLVWE